MLIFPCTDTHLNMTHPREYDYRQRLSPNPLGVVMINGYQLQKPMQKANQRCATPPHPKTFLSPLPKSTKISLQRIILRMQIHLLPLHLSPPLPHPPLHASHTPLHIHAHTRRPAHEHASLAAELPLHLLQHERDVRAAVLGAPGGLFGVDGG